MGSAVGPDGVPVEFVPQPGDALPETGSKAPPFVLPDADMDTFDLSEALSRNIVVLCFYPRDGTPAWTRQAIDFSDHDTEFTREGAVVVGVSADDCITHATFRDEHGLSIRLLSDPDVEVCRQYGVLQPREGVSRFSIRRTTFVIDRSGIIRFAAPDANLRGHVAEVLERIRIIARNSNGNHQELGRHA